MLSPPLASFVRHGDIRRFDVVRVTRVTLRFDDLRLGGEQVVLIDNLELLARHQPDFGAPLVLFDAANDLWTRSHDTNLLPALRSGDFDEYVDTPQVGARSYYVALQDNDTPVGKQWRKYSVRAPPELVFSDAQPHIADILSTLGKKHANQPEYVVGRIVSKSNLRHYASPDRKDKFPMNFMFELADNTAQVRVVVWTSCCFRYFCSIQIG